MPRSISPVILAAVLLTFTACTSPAGEDAPAGIGSTTVPSATVATSDSTVELAPAFDDEAALADGVVVPAELEAATFAITACIAAAGFKVEGPAWDASRRFFDYVYSAHQDVDPFPASECEIGPGSRTREAWALDIRERIMADDAVWVEFAACISELTGQPLVYEGNGTQQKLFDAWDAAGSPFFECRHPLAPPAVGSSG